MYIYVYIYACIYIGEVPMDLIEIGKRGDGTEEDKDMTNWNAMLQFVDDTQVHTHAHTHTHLFRTHKSAHVHINVESDYE
jgi:hypothetical protein